MNCDHKYQNIQAVLLGRHKRWEKLVNSKDRHCLGYYNS